MSSNLIVVLGPTAVGKTTFAAHLAAQINGEIISADSRQVYRGMTLGTGKDLDDYMVDGQQINHHLIDIVDAGYKYNVFEFQQDFFKAYNEIQNQNKTAVLCGGTGLYIESVLSNYKLLEVPSNEELRKSLQQKEMVELIEILRNLKETHNISDFDSKKRIIRAIEIEEYNKKNNISYSKTSTLSYHILGLYADREVVKSKITKRLEERLSEGMIEEVEKLINNGLTKEDIEYYGLEYKFLVKYIFGELSYEEMFSMLNIAIHQFSKRQMTWFRRMERNGFKIHWLNAEDGIVENVNKTLKIIDVNGNV